MIFDTSIVLAGYLAIGTIIAYVAMLIVTNGGRGYPDWWADDRKRRAFMLSWFLAWPVVIVALLVWKGLPMVKRFLWDE